MKTNALLHPITAPPLGRRASVLVALLTFMVWAGPAWAQSDDFNDGKDEGWYRYDPIGTHPLLPDIATFTLANGTYRIQTAPAVAAWGAGPGRAGSLNTNIIYTDFYVAVDVVACNLALDQSFGIMARVTNLGLGATDGYAMTWNQKGPDIDISVVTDEDPTEVQSVGNDEVTMVTDRTYRFVFIGKGTQLTGRVYELPNDITPVAEITGFDTTYDRGVCGMVVFDNGDQVNPGPRPTDATFDNYLALPEEPPRMQMTRIPDIGEVKVFWPASFTGFRLQSSPVVPARPDQWTDEVADLDETQEWYYHLEGSERGNKFFRLFKATAPAAR